MIEVSFLVVNYFSSKYTKKLVESIHRYIQNYSFEILILDNSNDSLEFKNLVEIDSKCVETIKASKNLGFVKANNQLFELASGEIIVLINPDALLKDSTMENIFKYVLNNQNIGLVGPKLLNEDNSYQVSYSKFPNILSTIKEHFLLFDNPYIYNNDCNGIHECDVVKGACLISTYEELSKHGLFNDKIIMYSEEVELALRMKKNGLTILYFGECSIYHYGQKSTSQDHISDYSLYHYYRSKIIYFDLHYSKFKKCIVKTILLFSLIEKTLLFLVIGKKNKSFAHFRTFLRIIKVD